MAKRTKDFHELALESARAKEDTRLVFNGIYYTQNETVSTDGRCLFISKRELSEGKAHFAGKIIGKDGEVIKGTFPDYKYLLSQKNEHVYDLVIPKWIGKIEYLHFEFPDLTIQFKGVYLKLLEEKLVRVSIKDGNSPVFFHDSKDDSWVYLVMPMKLNEQTAFRCKVEAEKIEMAEYLDHPEWGFGKEEIAV